jgi:osmoprotectant transport system ATP-binding protein
VHATDEPRIRLEGVSKRYDDGTTAVDDLSLDVLPGELAVLVGPSGCGKTTTMKMVNRLIEPTSGRVLLDGEDVAKTSPVQLRRRVGYVIQQVGLFPHQTVRDNVATVPVLLGWDKTRTRKRVEELLDLVGLEPSRYAGRYPSQLSGGQRQRVGVARALAADPLVLLMDEPFSAVDPIAREHLQSEFLRVQRELGTTVVFVTHDIDEAVRLGDRIAVLREGGHLEQYDTPATVLGSPATPFVADFVGADRAVKRLSVTAIDVDALEQYDGDVAATLPVEADLGQALAVLLATGDERIAVTNGEGARLGTLTVAGLLAQARRSSRNRARTSGSSSPRPLPISSRARSTSSARLPVMPPAEPSSAASARDARRCLVRSQKKCRS